MKKNIIFSTYFTSKPDIRRGFTQNVNDFTYIRRWYKSINKLDLKAIIFYDNLSEGFVRKYRKSSIKFQKVKLGSLSNNDERFFIYYHYLKKHKYNNIFMTDISDVWFKSDPFKLINNRHHLYVGSQQSTNNESNWWQKCYKKIYGGIPAEVDNKIMMNAGIIGGAYKKVIKFLSIYTSEMKKLEKDKSDVIKKYDNISFNMMALNMIIYSNYKREEIYTGKKLHSPFKSYLSDGDYCIFHK